MPRATRIVDAKSDGEVGNIRFHHLPPVLAKNARSADRRSTNVRAQKPFVGEHFSACAMALAGLLGTARGRSVVPITSGDPLVVEDSTSAIVTGIETPQRPTTERTASSRQGADEEATKTGVGHSTVTVLARLRGWSTSRPRRWAMW